MYYAPLGLLAQCLGLQVSVIITKIITSGELYFIFYYSPRDHHQALVHGKGGLIRSSIVIYYVSQLGSLECGNPEEHRIYNFLHVDPSF